MKNISADTHENNLIKEILDKLEKALEAYQLNKVNTRKKLPNIPELVGVLGVSDYILELKKDIEKTAQRDMTVLIIGERGTGKESIPKAIHKLSNRKDYQFKTVNCSTLTNDFLRSELFGHVKGAFAGAVKDRTGVIEAAKKGTVFLDEIGKMDLKCQGQILRLLQEKEICTFGADGKEITKKVDVRIIAATNDPNILAATIDPKEFLPDLYDRLRGRVIETKPLAERPEDIVVLLNYFLNLEINNNKAFKPDPRTKWLLYNYDFPGNVRELKNLLENMGDYDHVKTQVGRESKKKKYINETIKIAEKYYKDINYLIKAHEYATLLSVPNISLVKISKILNYRVNYANLNNSLKFFRSKFNMSDSSQPDENISNAKGDKSPNNKEEITHEQRKIINHIRENGFITNKTARQMFRVAQKTIVAWCNELMEKGLIVREGKGRSAKYVLSPEKIPTAA